MAEPAWVEAVHRFWFQELRPAQWWKADPAVDETIRRQFRPVHEAVRKLGPKAPSARVALCGVIVLDQFSRNMFRGTTEAFAYDGLALARSEAAIAAGFAASLSDPERQFLYMPLMHCEDPAVQARSLELFGTVNVRGALKSAREHKAVIDRFGRFPQRNAALGRASTQEELAFSRRSPPGLTSAEAACQRHPPLP